MFSDPLWLQELRMRRPMDRILQFPEGMAGCPCTLAHHRGRAPGHDGPHAIEAGLAAAEGIAGLRRRAGGHGGEW